MTAQGKFVNRTDEGIKLTPKGRALGIFSLLTAFGLLTGVVQRAPGGIGGQCC